MGVQDLHGQAALYMSHTLILHDLAPYDGQAQRLARLRCHPGHRVPGTDRDLRAGLCLRVGPVVAGYPDCQDRIPPSPALLLAVRLVLAACTCKVGKLHNRAASNSRAFVPGGNPPAPYNIQAADLVIGNIRTEKVPVPE